MDNDYPKNPRRSSGRVTLADVAALAGVSPISVSRALKKPDMVTDKLRLKIDQAVRTLGYIPNQAARSLASSETKIISVLFPSLSNSVFSSLLDGIYDTLTPAGYQMLLTNTHYSSVQEEELIETMLEQNPDGIILTGIDQSDSARQRLMNIGIPVVQLMELTDNPIDINVGISHYKAGYSMTEYLISKGHQHIGFIGARMDNRSQRRLQGYRQALIDHSLPSDDYVLTSFAHTSFHAGAELMDKLVSEHNQIDALFCSNDDLAAGAIFECQRQGIKVPQQLAIAGFNDLEIASAMSPSLTSVAIPRFAMGQQAAQCLLDRLHKKPCPTQIDVGFSIVPRESS
jgi:LacI family gluconate utilization system Gnt-I transcriptional repressor